MRFCTNNSWEIDSNFKTNVYGLPLFAAVLANKLGMGIPIWFMLHTINSGAHHGVIALEVILCIIFSRIGHIHLSALVI